jgi:hypothetical protein
MTPAIFLSQRDQMFRRTSTAIHLWIASLLFLSAVYTFAQVSTANVVGIVEDSTGARLPDATIKLINSQTGTENNSKTNHVGVFLLPGIFPGMYSLQIEREGFATAQFTGLTLNVGDTKSVLVRMQLGSITQTVQIDASGVSPNTGDASISTVVDRGFVANIPLNGRSFQHLISMVPGVVTQTPQALGAGYGAQGDFSVSGQQPDKNSYIIDGVSADIGVGLLRGHTKFASSGRAGTTALGTTQSLVSIDDLQEFRVLTSNYSAEYGGTSGGQFTLLTRSGTNSFHGSVFDYVRNNAADAADWFTNFNSTDLSLPYQQNDFGGALGGPVSLPGLYDGHDKTFFFVSYEGLHVTEPTAPLVEYVPSLQIIAAVPAPIQKILMAFPPPYQLQYGSLPNTPPASTGLSPFVPGSLSSPGSINSTSSRIDHSFSPKILAFLRSSLTPSKNESTVLSSSTADHINTEANTLGVSFQLSAASSNEFRLGQLSDVWCTRLVLMPEHAMDSEQTLVWPDHEGPIVGSGIMGGFGVMEEAYVRDEVLLDYENRPEFDIHPEDGSVGHDGWWSVGYCWRVGRDHIGLELRKLYEGAQFAVIKHYCAFAVKQESIPDLSETKKVRNIGMRAHELVKAYLDLIAALHSICDASGLSFTEMEIGSFSSAEIQSKGWWTFDALGKLGNVSLRSMTYPHFLARCKDLHALMEGLKPGPLRSLLRTLGVSKSDVDQHQSLKLSAFLCQLATVAQEQHWGLVTDSALILAQWDKSKLLDYYKPLFALNVLRQADSHTSSSLDPKNQASQLATFGIDPDNYKAGWGLALDLVYDRMTVSLRQATELLQSVEL